jgi:glycosyltransferase involved in cell wall biosynthesis
MQEQMRLQSGNTDQAQAEADRMAALEHRVWRELDVILYPSNVETAHVQAWLAEEQLEVDARTVPVYCFDDFSEDPAENLASRTGILYVAGFKHIPNIDGARWFMSEVMPLVWSARPDARLALVGSHPTEEIQSMANDRVQVTGFVTDEELNAWYTRARVAVAPLRFGAGIKGKVVESLAHGLPMVTTSTGCQGLEAAADFLPPLDDPEATAQEVLNLLNDDALWRQRSLGAQAYAREHFSVPAMKAVLAPYLLNNAAPYAIQ